MQSSSLRLRLEGMDMANDAVRPLNEHIPTETRLEWSRPHYWTTTSFRLFHFHRGQSLETLPGTRRACSSRGYSVHLSEVSNADNRQAYELQLRSEIRNG